MYSMADARNLPTVDRFSAHNYFVFWRDVHPDVRFNAGPSNGCHLGTTYSHARRAAFRAGMNERGWEYACARARGETALSALRTARRY